METWPEVRPRGAPARTAAGHRRGPPGHLPFGRRRQSQTLGETGRALRRVLEEQHVFAGRVPVLLPLSHRGVECVGADGRGRAWCVRCRGWGSASTRSRGRRGSHPRGGGSRDEGPLCVCRPSEVGMGRSTPVGWWGQGARARRREHRGPPAGHSPVGSEARSSWVASRGPALGVSCGRWAVPSTQEPLVRGPEEGAAWAWRRAWMSCVRCSRAPRRVAAGSASRASRGARSSSGLELRRPCRARSCRRPASRGAPTGRGSSSRRVPVGRPVAWGGARAQRACGRQGVSGESSYSSRAALVAVAGERLGERAVGGPVEGRSPAYAGPRWGRQGRRVVDGCSARGALERPDM